MEFKSMEFLPSQKFLELLVLFAKVGRQGDVAVKDLGAVVIDGDEDEDEFVSININCSSLSRTFDTQSDRLWLQLWIRMVG